MITLSNLRKILDSIEQSTGNPNLLITFEIDHGHQDPYEPDPKNTVDTIQSVDLNLDISIDPESPEPQKAPEYKCIITLE